jgi:nicotinate-nucleotide adenylyltransferase
MSTLCFGGSFNPIHHGHLICARAAAEQLGMQKVLLIPSYQPPHKIAGQDIAAPEDRATMCRLAVEGDPLFSVSDIELKRAGPSYTIDTVRQLKREGWPQVRWLIGADMLRILPQWREPLALLNEARLFLLARPGWSFDWQTLPAEYQHLAADIVPAPLIDIRATDIRERLRLGKPVSYLVPTAVESYIRSRGLYPSM